MIDSFYSGRTIIHPDYGGCTVTFIGRYHVGIDWTNS